MLALGLGLSGAAVSWMSFNMIEGLYRMHLTQMYDTYIEQELKLEDMRLYDSIDVKHVRICSCIAGASQEESCV